MLKVSIITVVLNNGLYIKDAIESVVYQQSVDLEYIIIDGGSSDDSLTIINSFKDKIAVFISEPDEGIYNAMNKGLLLATGDVIGFLNADDFYANNQVINQVVNTFEHFKCDAVYADLDYVSRSNKSKIIRKWRSGGFKRTKFLMGWMPAHPTFFVKKDSYVIHGNYNEQLHYAADYELMLRFLYVKNISVAYLKTVIVKMRLGGQSNRSLKNRLAANMEDRKAWTIHGLNPKWYTLIIKPLSKIIQYFI